MSSRWVLRRVRRRGVRGLAGAASVLLGWSAAAWAQPEESPSPSASPPRPAPAQPVSVPGGLTAADAARRAAETSVEANVRHQQVVAARAVRERVFWEAAPRLTLTAQTTRLSPVSVVFDFGGVSNEVPQPESAHTLNARLSVPLSDYLLRTVRAVRGANANRAAAELEERAARVTAAANAKLAFYDWVRAQLEAVLARQSLETATLQLERVRALVSVGRSAEADLLQAQAFRADAELAQSQADTQRLLAEERLRVAIHANPDEQLQVGEDVLAPFAGAAENASLDELYREALEHRLELRALEKSREAVQNVSGVEASRALPTLEGYGNVTHANPNQRVFPLTEDWNTTWEVGLVLAWSVNDIGTAGTRADELGAQAVQIQGQRTQVEEALRIEVASALAALRQAALSVATAEQGERAAAAAFTARERLQEQGMATTLELMQAETARVQARLNVINAHITLRVARVQLDHAVGRDVQAQP